jgi:hypothetical protein
MQVVWLNPSLHIILVCRQLGVAITRWDGLKELNDFLSGTRGVNHESEW